MHKLKFACIALGVAILMVLVSMKVYADLSFRAEQRDLADRFGVKLEDYQPTKYFPENYFYSILTPEMTRREVHQVVVGYEQAFTCGNLAELYYFYSKDETNAMRFKIIYDFDGKFVKLIGEDDSGRLYDEDCVVGLADQ